MTGSGIVPIWVILGLEHSATVQLCTHHDVLVINSAHSWEALPFHLQEAESVYDSFPMNSGRFSRLSTTQQKEAEKTKGPSEKEGSCMWYLENRSSD